MDVPAFEGTLGRSQFRFMQKAVMRVRIMDDLGQFGMESVDRGLGWENA